MKRLIKQTLLIAVLSLCALPTWAQPEFFPEITVILGEGRPPVRFTESDLARLLQRSVTVEEYPGEARYEGVALADVLQQAGVPMGDSLSGPRLAQYVVVEAEDGYRVVFALAELDQSFTDREVLLANRRNGEFLLEDDGPFRIIVPGEKRHARWVRQATRIIVSTADP
jgi:hypothetical protein